MARAMRYGVIALLAAVPLAASAGSDTDGRWFPDQQDGTYRNPVLAGDYSDPDVVRVGRDYYLTASSFTDVPGLPILHSRDLVNWALIGHALRRLPPDDHYRTPRRGGGVWAPAIRYHGGKFIIYYPDPDRGIFLVTASDPRGPWSDPVLVDGTRGAIDPCPFWDDDGTGWLVHAYARSRSGKANLIVLKRLNADGTGTVDAGRVVIDGAAMGTVKTSLGPRPWQTTEGPKLYKRDGWYYIFAPSGGVKGGWQGVFRSRNIAGPYEGRNVLDQGGSDINGPHQGAWVTTPQGKDWFLHFRDRDSYGRIVHLEPMAWRGGWPVIGADPDGDGRGTPVARYRKPVPGNAPPIAPMADDDFGGPLSLAWQWGSNPGADWMRLEGGWLHLESVTGSPDLYENGAVLSQNLPALTFTATTVMRFAPLRQGERAGLALHGTNYGWIGLERDGDGVYVVQRSKSDATPGGAETLQRGPAFGGDRIWLRLSVSPKEMRVPPPDFSPYWPSMLRETHAMARFSYSLDGETFVPLGAAFEGLPGRWVGAQIGLFSQAASGTPAATATSVGEAEFDWFRITR